MAPVTQYVFAEMLGISEHFTAGSHEWLPYSVDEVCLKCSNTNLSRCQSGDIPQFPCKPGFFLL